MIFFLLIPLVLVPVILLRRRDVLLFSDERRNLYPLTRRQMSDLPPGLYVAERIGWWLQVIAGGMVGTMMLLWAIAVWLGY